MKSLSRITTNAFRKSWSSQSLLKSKISPKPFELRRIHKKKQGKSEYFPVKQTIQKEKESWFLIYPESLLKLFWDLCCISITISHAFIIPYHLSFSFKVSNEIQTYLEISNIMLIINIPISCNTCLYRKGRLLTDRKTIMKFYLKNYLIIDLWNILPFQILLLKEDLSQSFNPTALLLLLKMLRLYYMRSLFFTIEDFWSNPTSVFLTRLLYFTIVFSLLCHFICCFMEYNFKISLSESSQDWVLYKHIPYDMYLRQIYIVILTMTSVGYESPKRSFDQNLLGIILVMCIESLIFAFTLGEIQSIVSKYTYYSNQTKDMIYQIKKVLDKKNIPKNLRYRIIRYVNYMREVEKENVGKETELLCMISQPLKLEIFTYTRAAYLENHAVFQNYSTGFIKFIGYFMKMQICSKGDLVLLEGEKGSSIYFIINGSVDIFNQNSKTIYKSLSKSKSFGEIGFFLGICRSASARCDSFTELVYLDKETFNRLLTDHPSEQVITKEIIKRAEKDLSMLGIKCYLCKKLTHIAKDCKRMLIKLQKDKIMEKAALKRNGGGKKVNLAFSIDKKFMRPLHESDLMRKYAIVNAKGRNSHSPTQKKGSTLAKKAEKYVNKLQILMPVSGKKLRIVEDSDEEKEKNEKFNSILPKSKRYIENFLKSRRRKSNTEIPQIVVNPD